MAQTTVSEAAQYHACLQRVQGNPDSAYDEALAWRDRGGGVPASHCVALALVGLGKHAEAASRLAALADLPGGRRMAPALLAQAGNAWLLADKPGNAYNVLSTALNLDPETLSVAERVDLLIDRASALAALARWEEAEADLSKALSLDPEQASAYVYRATVRRMRDQTALALEDLQLALALSPNDAAALLERGIIYRLQEKPDAARADWMAAIALDPDSKIAEAARLNLEKLDVKSE